MARAGRFALLVALPLVSCTGAINGDMGEPSSPAMSAGPTPGSPAGSPSPSGTAVPPGAPAPGSPAPSSMPGSPAPMPGGPTPEPLAPPSRHPNAAAAETSFLRLPMGVYSSAVQAVLRPLGPVDTGRLSSLIATAPLEEPGTSGFVEPTPPGTSTVRFYLEVAEQMTASLLRSTSLPCAKEDASKELPCIDALVTASGRRAFRRPLTPEELAAYRAQYVAGRDAFDRATGVVTVLRSLLTAPDFIFAVEGLRSASKSDVVPLDGWEVATRLAIALWAAAPDDPLLDAAAKGELDAPDGVEAAARRMLADARASRGLGGFAAQWLHFTDGTLNEARTEATLLLEDLLLKGEGKLGAVFTARHSFATAGLATRYGTMQPAGSGKDAFVRIELPPERVGLFSLSGVLRGNGSPTASPIKRGKVIRERLFCLTVPPPPQDVPPLSAVKMAPNPSLRARLEQHRSDPACAGCHNLIDPIGFALEAFDHEGKHRTTDGGIPVDVRGALEGTDVDGPIAGAAALAMKLAASRMVGDCAATQWFRFALGRLDDRHDAAELARAREAFAKSGGNVRELLATLARGEALRTRRAREITK